MEYGARRGSCNHSNYLGPIWRTTELDMPFKYNVSNLPLLSPVTVVVPAAPTQTISFPDNFQGRAVAVKLSNNDGANNASYFWNLNAGQVNILRSSSFDTIDGTSVDYLTLTTGAAGNVVVQAQVLPIRQEEVIAERESVRSYGDY